LRDSV